MTIKDDRTLADALDGLITATRYCEDRGMDELAEELGGLYQRVGDASPTDDWDPVGEDAIEWARSNESSDTES